MYGDEIDVLFRTLVISKRRKFGKIFKLKLTRIFFWSPFIGPVQYKVGRRQTTVLFSREQRRSLIGAGDITGVSVTSSVPAERLQCVRLVQTFKASMGLKR